MNFSKTFKVCDGCKNQHRENNFFEISIDKNGVFHLKI